MDADEARGGVDGVAVGNSFDASRVGGTTEGVAQRALGPLPPRPVLRTAATVVALAASTGPAVCTDGCAGGTCRNERAGTIVPAAILAATAPTVANPYPNAAGGTAAGTAGVVGGAAGVLDVAPSDAPPAAAGAAVVGNIPPADGDVQGALGLFVPRTFTEEELREADPHLQRISAADRRLLGIFGDTIHLNDGTHLDGGIGVNEDAKWQRLYNRVASCSLPLYDLPNGRWAHRFLTTLTDLWAGVIQRRWNSERPLVFQAVILRRVRGITRFHDVKPIVWNRLDAWDAGRYVALVKGVEEAYLDSSGGGRRVEVRRQDDATSLARRYDAMVLGGKVRAAVRMVTDRGTGGPYRPNDLDSKSGRPVIDVLRDKHPDCVVPSEEAFDAYPDADDLLDTMPVYCFEECVAKAAARLSGGAGPCGVEAEMLKHWLLRHGAHSERLRAVMADWVVWLSNGSPPYAAYRAVNTVRTVALDKRPGVRPLGVGEVWMRLWSDCSHLQTKSAATIACGNTQLCAGLRSGIEANLHAVRAIWPQSAGWTEDGASEEEDDGDPSSDATLRSRIRAEGVLAPGTDPGAAEDATFSRYEPETGFGTALFDARNGFNEINRYLMLWNVAHRWNQGSRFAFNRYRHWVRCLVRSEPGEPALVIHSKEGITQGDCLAMSLYGVALMPLASKMREAIPEALQPGYCDDVGAAGRALPNARCLDFLVKFGPTYGYFPEPGKSHYICKAEDEPAARQAFEGFGLEINYSRGQRYLGGFIGSARKKEEWLGDMVGKWVGAVKALSVVAERYPQTAYAGFTFSLQNEWQYVQRVVADTGPFFQPLEKEIRTSFLPALLGIPPTAIDGDYRQLLTHGVKQGGLAIRNPVDTAQRIHSTSLAATRYLTESLVREDAGAFDLGVHRKCATEAGRIAREFRLMDEQRFLDVRGRDNPSVARRDKRNSAAGAWLSVFPNRLNGTDLSADEWRDNVRLRYNHSPLDMPAACDGCGAKMTVEHALSCKVGGLVHIRHDDVADEWRHLCGTALSPSRVEREPPIFRCVSHRARVAAGNTTPPPPSTPTATPPTPPTTTEERGDASCHGFWKRGRTCIFDMRITDTDAKSYRKKDFGKVLLQHEKEKKDKYLRTCLELRKDFTPMVYSVDGIAGREARNAEKRLATHLASKWNRGYSQMVYYVRVRMAIAVVRANSLLIRGSRDRQQPRRPLIPDGAALGDWRTWQDN